jgi:ABC-2 type transport system ATP-binding protein
MTRRDRRAIVSAMLTNSLEAAAAMRTATAIEVRGVRKAYGDVKALDGVDLTVRRGEVLALLGPNGAGKTTLVEILEGHRRADAGDVRVLGFDPARRERAFRERIGIVLLDAALEREPTASRRGPARCRTASGAGSTSRSASPATRS